MPFSQPIRCKAKINCDFVIRVFPRLKKSACFQFVFSLANDNVNCIGRCDYIKFCFGFSTQDLKLLLSNKITKSFFASFEIRVASFWYNLTNFVVKLYTCMSFGSVQGPVV